MRKKKLKIVGYTLGALSLVFLKISIFIFYNQNNFNKTAIKTQGTIINYSLESSLDSDGRYSNYTYPVIKFQDEFNNEIIWKSNFTNNNAIIIGEKVALLYDKNDPKNVSIDTFMGKWIGVVITGTFFLFFGGFALAFIFIKA